jgi:hypothetical protein
MIMNTQLQKPPKAKPELIQPVTRAKPRAAHLDEMDDQPRRRLLDPEFEALFDDPEV